MSRNIKRRRTIILVIAALALVLATGAYIVIPRGVTQMDLVTDAGETINETLEVYVGTETQLSCKTVPESFMNRTVEYMIADEEVATIDENGLLKALKEGETRLTVECAGVKKNYKIKTQTAVEDITGLDKEITLYEGEEYQLKPKVKMAEKDLEKPEIEYTTKRNTIASVDKKGLITAVKEGETTVTVSAGDLTKKVKVIVEARPVETSAPIVYYSNDTNNNDNKANKRTNRNTGKKNGGNNGGNSAGDGGSSGGGSGGGSDSGE